MVVFTLNLAYFFISCLVYTINAKRFACNFMGNRKKNIRRMCYITQPDLMTLFYENMCDGLDAIDTIYSHQHWYMV